jgi:hypothetical protein
LGAGAMAHGTHEASEMTRLAEPVDFFPIKTLALTHRINLRLG